MREVIDVYVVAPLHDLTRREMLVGCPAQQAVSVIFLFLFLFFYCRIFLLHAF
jgi:type IV secretory pathway VirB3-like protein